MTYKIRLNGDETWWSSSGSLGADKRTFPLPSALPASVYAYRHQAVKSTHRKAQIAPGVCLTFDRPGGAVWTRLNRRFVLRAEAAMTALARTLRSPWQAACSKSATRGIITGMRFIFHYWNAPVVNLISEYLCPFECGLPVEACMLLYKRPSWLCNS